MNIRSSLGTVSDEQLIELRASDLSRYFIPRYFVIRSLFVYAPYNSPRFHFELNFWYDLTAESIINKFESLFLLSILDFMWASLISSNESNYPKGLLR